MFDLQKAIHFVSDPNEIRLIANFIHREILQLLSEQPMTQTELAKSLSLTKPALGYHLRQLFEAKLIYIIKTEAETHGILQKFYSPIANMILSTYNQTPDDLKRYFIQVQIEHVIGIIAAYQGRFHYDNEVYSATVEKLAILLWKQVESVCNEYLHQPSVQNTESLKIKIYAEAFRKLKKTPEWKALFPRASD